MTEFEREVLITFSERQGLDPVEVAWHKEEYQNTALYQLMEIIVEFRVMGRGIAEGFKELFQGGKP